ncbi:4-hydroxybenzoate polyprenyltransferase [Kibdelosporangium banguiense]|uniref:4-hydroxybenzoate polyprenyltransferase n=1 Tax=Kibdelosporangium banguiense TaxID=1365924 RepID=A0ABS4U1T1_9PSEU|nr:UbiA family prenyltransferase [Kibdelosporangium banguiense]MBP2330580.1 4-hydroxybenzoate polyprenyltransferase [Kibdelosporangium banguiense]
MPRFGYLAWVEARPVVQLIFQLRFATGVVFGTGSAIGHNFRPGIAVAALGWLAATWAIYLINGVTDIAEDRENGSQRPIAQGRLPLSAATTICWILVALAVACCLFVSVHMAVLVAIMLAVGWAYSMGPCPFKMSMPGFLASVTTLGLVTYLAGWCAAGGEWSNPLLIFGIVMSLWMGLVGSTKDLPDTEGDRLAGRRTPPIVFGQQRARALIAILASVVGWTFLIASATARWAGGLLPAAVVVCTGSIAVSVVLLSAISRGDRRVRRRPYRVFMTTQYATHTTLLSANVVP